MSILGATLAPPVMQHVRLPRLAERNHTNHTKKYSNLAHAQQIFLSLFTVRCANIGESSPVFAFVLPVGHHLAVQVGKYAGNGQPLRVISS